MDSLDILKNYIPYTAVHAILEEFSQDVNKDCLTISGKLLKLMFEKKKVDSKTLLAVKALLKIFQNSCEKSSLSSYKIIENLKLALEIYIRNKRWRFFKDINQRMLSVISLVFEIGIRGNCPEDMKELIEIQNKVLGLINLHCKEDDKTEELLFEIEILTIIQKVSKLKIFDVESQESLTRIRTLLASLILDSSSRLEMDVDKVAVQTILYLIPALVKSENTEILEAVWMEISNRISSSKPLKLSRALMILTNYFQICFSINSGKSEKSVFIILKDKNFWFLVLKALENENFTIRKQGRFLLEEIMQAFEKHHCFVTVQGRIIYFIRGSTENIEWNLYCNYLTEVFQFLEEEQFHIIEPILVKIKYYSEWSSELCWTFLIYKRLLTHKSSQVVKWGLSNFLKLSNNFFTDEPSAAKSALLLAKILRNQTLYYSNTLAVILELSDFFEVIAGLSSAKVFFSNFIRGVTSEDWSSEALFFVMHSLSRVVKKFSFWGKTEISKLRAFVSRVFDYHYKPVRIGTQYELIRTVSNFTNETDVPLKDVVAFISSFSTEEVAKVGSSAWEVLTDWLQSCYNEKQFKNILEKFKRNELGNEFSNKCVALTLVLLYCSHEWNAENPSAMNYFQEMLASFSAVRKRPYCEKSLLDQCLSIICHILKISDSLENFKRPCLPFVRDIIVYIYTQLQHVSNINDYDACQEYISAFETIIENSILFEIRPEEVKDLFEEISNELESSSSSIVSIGLYWRVPILRVIYTFYNFEPKPKFLQFLLKNANKCLSKIETNSETPRFDDLSWGEINSKFVIEKWKILIYFINRDNTATNLEILKNWYTQGDWIKLWIEASSDLFSELSSLAMSVLRKILLAPRVEEEIKNSIQIVWNQTEISQLECLHEDLLEIVFLEHMNRVEDKLTEENSIKKIKDVFKSCGENAFFHFLKVIQKQFYNETICSEALAPFLCEVLASGLTFSESMKKDKSLQYTACSYVEALKISSSGIMNENCLKSEFCPRSVERILELDRNSLYHQKFAKNLIKHLMKPFNNPSIFKTNLLYLREMQALLLLEPMLPSNEDLAEELSDSLFRSLRTENLHPGVRHLQEWLLIRMLLRHSICYSQYRGLNNVVDFSEAGKKGLCSLMTISFHLCCLLPPDEKEKRIQGDINVILSLCFHQNFEVRLYAMVVFQELYKLAENRKLNEITSQYQGVHVSMKKSFEMSLKGNVSKNVDKLTKNFFLKKFHPLKHYSLQTIYMDLPRLSNIEPHLWISRETFQRCGIEFDKLDHFPKTPAPSLIDEETTKELKEESVAENTSPFEGDVVYYQKKRVPLYTFNNVDDRGKDGVKRGELIVVASLVECIPNLGGLCRSCEVFGASKFVVHSHKLFTDKKFTSLSVTAEKWINIEEVRIEMLLDYLTGLKRRGYTLIGAEQSLNSRSLDSVVFPKKSVLLLGNEKKGIPPYLLPLLEICVEIPQLGKIRSLNVHVAGALFMWEYAKRHKLF